MNGRHGLRCGDAYAKLGLSRSVHIAPGECSMISGPRPAATSAARAAELECCWNPADDDLGRDRADRRDVAPHILLVEPDDELCVWLWHAAVASKARPTIADSLGSAASALCTAPDICLIIVDAELPDGEGAAVSASIARWGLPFLLIQRLASGLRVYDWLGRISDESECKATEFVGPAITMARMAAISPRMRH